MLLKVKKTMHFTNRRDAEKYARREFGRYWQSWARVEHRGRGDWLLWVYERPRDWDLMA